MGCKCLWDMLVKVASPSLPVGTEDTGGNLPPKCCESEIEVSSTYEESLLLIEHKCL